MKKSLTALFVVFAFFVLPSTAYADGILIPPKRVDRLYETGQKAVIWYQDNRETLILSTTFKGDVEEFVWVIPVPERPEVEKSKDELFTSLEDYTQPPQPEYDKAPLLGGVGNLNSEQKTPTVRVVETKRVDIYDTVVLEANDADALQDWLTDNSYDYPENKRHLLEHYIQKNWYFVVAKINDTALGYTASQLRTGHATPLSITFDTPNIIYPLRISGLGAEDVKDKGKIGAYSFESGSQEWSMKATPNPEGPSNTLKTVRTTLGEAYDGKYSLLLADADIITSSISSPIVLNNQLEYNNKYVVSGFLKVENPKSARIYVAISNNSQTLPITDLTEYSDWKRFELPFTYSRYGNITIQVQEANGESVYLDALQIEEGEKASDFIQEILPAYKSANKLIDNTDPDSPVKIILYVFADKKQSVPGFDTEFADNVDDKVYSKFALKDNGDPWIDANGKVFLTKLTNTLPPSQMVDDLILRGANDQSKVNAKSLGFPFIAGVFLLLLISAEMIIALYFWKRYSKKSEGL